MAQLEQPEQGASPARENVSCSVCYVNKRVIERAKRQDLPTPR